VTNADSGESRKTHAPAISRGCPSRPKSVREPAIARCWGVAVSNAGVSVGPGDTALTRTPAGDTSRASDFVSAITPPLAAAWCAAGRTDPYSPAVDAKFATDPFPRATIAGSRERQETNAVFRLASSV